MTVFLSGAAGSVSIPFYLHFPHFPKIGEPRTANASIRPLCHARERHTVAVSGLTSRHRIRRIRLQWVDVVTVSVCQWVGVSGVRGQGLEKGNNTLPWFTFDANCDKSSPGYPKALWIRFELTRTLWSSRTMPGVWRLQWYREGWEENRPVDWHPETLLSTWNLIADMLATGVPTAWIPNNYFPQLLDFQTWSIEWCWH